MDDPAQNPPPFPDNPLRASITGDNTSVLPGDNPPAEPPSSAPLSPPPTPKPPLEPTTPQADQTTPLEPLAPSTTDVPTPPQESLAGGSYYPTQQPPEVQQPADQYQTPPESSPYQTSSWGQTPTGYEQAAGGYPQPPETEAMPPQEIQTAPGTPPPPEEPKATPAKGFIIGGLLALIVIAVIFGTMTILGKKSSGTLPTPGPSKTAPNEVVTPTQPPLKAVETPIATTAPSPTPKTTETFTNTTYKYTFEYPLGLTAPTKITADPARFSKALEVVKLPLSKDPTATISAYLIVWDKVDDVPKYITDGQSQFVKVNVYTTNRFTLKKPSGMEETHYLTQKFNDAYDIAMENPTGRISDPAFEKILNTFTFLEQSPSDAINQPAVATSTGVAQTLESSPSASPKTSPALGF